ncbi:hypothetical protein ACIGFK_39205 [Streptomyces sp. NPDC085524]|uniref:hypothetical protein n=1 Tax=unclassified Streptomyces TaxID=2593676 RepID=UPI0035D633D5
MRSTTVRWSPLNQVKDLADVVTVSVDCAHVLALSADGTVKPWGRNGDGRPGNGSTAPSAVRCPGPVGRSSRCTGPGGKTALFHPHVSSPVR